MKRKTLAIPCSIVMVQPPSAQGAVVERFRGHQQGRRRSRPSTSSVSCRLFVNDLGGRVAALCTTTVVVMMMLLVGQDGGVSALTCTSSSNGSTIARRTARAATSATRSAITTSCFAYRSNPAATRSGAARAASRRLEAHSSVASPAWHPYEYRADGKRMRSKASWPAMVAADGSLSSKFSIPSASSAQQQQQQLLQQQQAVGTPATGDVAMLGNAGAVAAGDVVEESGKHEQGKAQGFKVAMFFFFWYTFNVGYNLCTKFTLNVLRLPMTLAALQMLVGVPYVWGLWLTGLRKAPRIGLSQVRAVVPVAAAHTLAHLGAVVSIGAGAVGFVQVVKAAEPLFTAGLSFLTGSAMPWPVYLTLLPVIGGVTMASVGEISFSVLAFGAAMTSNASAASRSVLGKKFMAKTKKEDGLDAGNLYAVMTMLGCLVLTPLALAMEGPKVTGVWSAAVNAGHSPASLIKNGFLSGLFFYLYNEVSFYALNAIHPVTHALGNTLKRVVMIAVSVVVLKHTFTPLGLVGCCTAIGGVMAYSVTKAKLQGKVSASSNTLASSAEICAAPPSDVDAGADAGDGGSEAVTVGATTAK